MMIYNSKIIDTMMNKLFTTTFFLFSVIFYAQVGINTQAPNATLDVVGKPTITDTPDGVIAPRLTGDQLAAKDDAYGTDQTGTLVYVTEAVTTATTKTANVTKTGYFMFDGAKWGYAFGGPAETVVPGQLVYYHGTISNATSSNSWMSSYLSDLPLLDGIIRLDGIFNASSVQGNGSVSFNPRLVNTSTTTNQKIWVAEISSVDRFNFSNVIIGANGGWINIDNGIYLNYGDNMTTSSTVYGTKGGTPDNNSNEVVVLDIILNSKWFRCYYFIIVDNHNQTLAANYTREVYLSIQRLY